MTLSTDLTVVGLAAAKANHNAKMNKADREIEHRKKMMVRLGMVILEREDHSASSSSSS